MRGSLAVLTLQGLGKLFRPFEALISRRPMVRASP